MTTSSESLGPQPLEVTALDPRWELCLSGNVVYVRPATTEPPAEWVAVGRALDLDQMLLRSPTTTTYLGEVDSASLYTQRSTPSSTPSGLTLWDRLSTLLADLAMAVLRRAVRRAFLP
jgi:hypothetical protein